MVSDRHQMESIPNDNQMILNIVNLTRNGVKMTPMRSQIDVKCCLNDTDGVKMTPMRFQIENGCCQNDTECYQNDTKNTV